MEMEGTGGLIEKPNAFLFTYRITPQSTTFNEQKINFKT